MRWMMEINFYCVLFKINFYQQLIILVCVNDALQIILDNEIILYFTIMASPILPECL